jgi:hypothetical protein
MQAGGPYYQVELGRLDGKVGTRAVVKHSLPGAAFDLDQLNKLFATNGLTQTDMIALSGIKNMTNFTVPKFCILSAKFYTRKYNNLKPDVTLYSTTNLDRKHI